MPNRANATQRGGRSSIAFHELEPQVMSNNPLALTTEQMQHMLVELDSINSIGGGPLGNFHCQQIRIIEALRLYLPAQEAEKRALVEAACEAQRSECSETVNYKFPRDSEFSFSSLLRAIKTAPAPSYETIAAKVAGETA
jgi:hypothetical protein